MNSDRWKAEQRDWLLRQLIELKKQWEFESNCTETVFAPDPEADRIAKGRTGGCAVQLDRLLCELYCGDPYAKYGGHIVEPVLCPSLKR